MYLAKVITLNGERCTFTYALDPLTIRIGRDGTTFRQETRVTRSWRHRYGASAIAQSAEIARLMAEQELRI